MGVRSILNRLGGGKRLAALATVALLGAGFVAQGALAGATPVAVRFGGDQDTTRVVLDIAQSTQGKIVSGAGGARELVVDFPKLDAVGSEGRGQGLVGDWTLTKAAGGARLRMTLNKNAVVDRRFLLAPTDTVKSYRYVIDLKATGSAPRANDSSKPDAISMQIAALIAPSVPAAAAAERPAAVTRVSTKPTSRKKVIVIDAGHGGHDPGALGSSAREKDVTLAAAKSLKSRLEKTGRYRVVMTRGDDTFVPLENRVQIARRSGADLFISLHADAGEEKATRGASVYTLSDQGSERVAKNINAGNDWFINVSMPGGTRAVREILFDLTQRATRNKSGAFAELLIERVGQQAPLLTRAHRDARYVVLFAPDVPAVLLEMGFMTNVGDEKLLTSQSQRAKLTEAIAKAIDDYFQGEVRIAAR
jgi:N-acetylmuramoyl-L-alanine amidase